MKIKIIKDDSIPSFGAFVKDSAKNGEAEILINCELHFKDGILETDKGEAFSFDNDYKKRAIIETMMHEFGHALEELFDTEFNEDLIDKAIESYDGTYKNSKF